MIKFMSILAIFLMLDHGNGLNKLPEVDDNDIVKVESIIRSTFNDLFSTLHFKKVRKKSRLEKFSLLHNYFASRTLQDHDSLKEVAKLARIDRNKLSRVTLDIIALIDSQNVDNSSFKNIITSDEWDYNVKTEREKIEGLKNYPIDDTFMIINKVVSNIMEQEEHSMTAGIEVKYTNSDNISTDLPTWHDTSSGRRLYDAKHTKISKYPFMASVHIFSKFQCAGSIIKSDLVITAASCLQLAWNNRFYRENPAFLSVRVGSSAPAYGGEEIAVMEIYFHPSYTPKNLHNNIAVMRLVRNIKFKNKKMKIEIDRGEGNLPCDYVVEILGWGARSSSNQLDPPWEAKLRHSKLTVFPIRDCRNIYSREFVQQNLHFCAGKNTVGSGACNGDVGGPGIVFSKLTGIVSFGSPQCGTPDAPTVFTRLGPYYDWIEDIMEQDVVRSYKKTTTVARTLQHDFGVNDGFTQAWNVQPLISDADRKPITSTLSAIVETKLSDINPKILRDFLKTKLKSDEILDFMNSNLNKDMGNKEDNSLREITTKPSATEKYKADLYELLKLTTQMPIINSPGKLREITAESSATEKYKKNFYELFKLTTQMPVMNSPAKLTEITAESSATEKYKKNLHELLKLTTEMPVINSPAKLRERTSESSAIEKYKKYLYELLNLTTKMPVINSQAKLSKITPESFAAEKYNIDLYELLKLTTQMPVTNSPAKSYGTILNLGPELVEMMKTIATRNPNILTKSIPITSVTLTTSKSMKKKASGQYRTKNVPKLTFAMSDKLILYSDISSEQVNDDVIALSPTKHATSTTLIPIIPFNATSTITDGNINPPTKKISNYDKFLQQYETQNKRSTAAIVPEGLVMTSDSSSEEVNELEEDDVESKDQMLAWSSIEYLNEKKNAPNNNLNKVNNVTPKKDFEVSNTETYKQVSKKMEDTKLSTNSYINNEVNNLDKVLQSKSFVNLNNVNNVAPKKDFEILNTGTNKQVIKKVRETEYRTNYYKKNKVRNLDNVVPTKKGYVELTTRIYEKDSQNVQEQNKEKNFYLNKYFSNDNNTIPAEKSIKLNKKASKQFEDAIDRNIDKANLDNAILSMLFSSDNEKDMLGRRAKSKETNDKFEGYKNDYFLPYKDIAFRGVIQFMPKQDQLKLKNYDNLTNQNITKSTLKPGVNDFKISFL